MEGYLVVQSNHTKTWNIININQVIILVRYFEIFAAAALWLIFATLFANELPTEVRCQVAGSSQAPGKGEKQSLNKKNIETIHGSSTMDRHGPWRKIYHYPPGVCLKQPGARYACYSYDLKLWSFKLPPDSGHWAAAYAGCLLPAGWCNWNDRRVVVFQANWTKIGLIGSG